MRTGLFISLSTLAIMQCLAHSRHFLVDLRFLYTYWDRDSWVRTFPASVPKCSRVPGWNEFTWGGGGWEGRRKGLQIGCQLFLSPA